MNGQTLKTYIVPLAGGVQSVYNASGFQYVRHSDWLGSSRLQLTWTGTLYGDRAYAPFGETYVETGAADRSFTGQTQDVIAGPTGIYDFLFRQQASSEGRWLVPDPAGLAAVDITNPQTWNRYAYVGNKIREKLRYMHRNPVKRGLVEKPEDWPWSSFRHYLTGEECVVEIESEWTWKKRLAMGIVPQMRVRENPNQPMVGRGTQVSVAWAPRRGEAQLREVLSRHKRNVTYYVSHFQSTWQFWEVLS
jgi:RHS repeat-associated protein